jgi:hypothetical protein
MKTVLVVGTPYFPGELANALDRAGRDQLAAEKTLAAAAAASRRCCRLNPRRAQLRLSLA